VHYLENLTDYKYT